jgi:hypothetical protein
MGKYLVMWMGWDYVSELQPPTGLSFVFQVIHMSMENHNGMISTGENFWLVYQSSLVILLAESSSRKSRETWGRKWWILPSKYLCSYIEVIFTWYKMLQCGVSGFTSLPKEGVLRISIAPKSPSPRQCKNPRTLGPMARTVTITQQRRPMGKYMSPLRQRPTPGTCRLMR